MRFEKIILKVGHLRIITPFIFLIFILMHDCMQAQKGMGAGLQYNTDGYSVLFSKYRPADQKGTHIYTLEFSEYLHNKELKIKNNISGVATSPFKYGKSHNNYFIKFKYGRDKVLFNNTGSSLLKKVGFQYQAGVSINMKKQYGLYYLNTDYNDNKEPLLYSSETHDRFLSKSKITGAQEWWKNWDRLTVNPGITLQSKLYSEILYVYNTSGRMYLGFEAAIFLNQIQHMVDIRGSFIQTFGLIGFEIILYSGQSELKYKR